MCKYFFTLFFMLQCTLFAKEVTLTEKDSGKSILLEVGDTLNVVLHGNPTTGYTWSLATFDDTHLKLTENAYHSSSNLCGAGGTFTFRFTPVSSGTTPLALEYSRSWEKGVPPHATFESLIEIR